MGLGRFWGQQQLHLLIPTLCLALAWASTQTHSPVVGERHLHVFTTQPNSCHARREHSNREPWDILESSQGTQCCNWFLENLLIAH